MKMRLFILVFTSFTLMLTYSASGLTPEQAKIELKKMNIEYTESEFLYRAKSGDTTAVSLFLDAGMNPNAKDKYGWTALMYTTWGKIYELQVNHKIKIAVNKVIEDLIIHKYEVTTRLLIQKGAAINTKTPNGRSVAWLEEHFGNNSNKRISYSSAGDRDHKFISPPKLPDRLEVLQEFLALNYEYTEVSFLKAVKQGDEKAVLLFLTLGMNPNAKDRFGKTALQIAEENKYSEIVKLLKHSGAKE